MSQHSFDNTPSLYIVPTPIGNMEDITLRALDTLKKVDLILCEDTRETLKLLKYFNIEKKVMSCHEWNEKSIRENVLKKLNSGFNIALVSDQGTPIISDPGYIISSAVINGGFNVISLPGSTAFVPALTSSGIEPQPFLFYGFLSPKNSKREKILQKLKNYDFTIIFYEAPHRLYDMLKALLLVFGDRNICICREISKVHEQIYRGKISDFCNEIDVLKGEFVIVVEGNKSENDPYNLSYTEHVKSYILDGMSEKDAIKMVSRERKVAKSVVYSEYHGNKKGA